MSDGLQGACAGYVLMRDLAFQLWICRMVWSHPTGRSPFGTDALAQDMQKIAGPFDYSDKDEVQSLARRIEVLHPVVPRFSRYRAHAPRAHEDQQVAAHPYDKAGLSDVGLAAFYASAS